MIVSLICKGIKSFCIYKHFKEIMISAIKFIEEPPCIHIPVDTHSEFRGCSQPPKELKRAQE